MQFYYTEHCVSFSTIEPPCSRFSTGFVHAIITSHSLLAYEFSKKATRYLILYYHADIIILRKRKKRNRPFACHKNAACQHCLQVGRTASCCPVRIVSHNGMNTDILFRRRRET